MNDEAHRSITSNTDDDYRSGFDEPRLLASHDPVPDGYLFGSRLLQPNPFRRGLLRRLVSWKRLLGRDSRLPDLLHPGRCRLGFRERHDDRQGGRLPRGRHVGPAWDETDGSRWREGHPRWQPERYWRSQGLVVGP